MWCPAIFPAVKFSRRAIVVIALGAIVVLFAMGTRQSFGLFLTPVTEELEIGRESFSLAMAIQGLIFGLPLVGILADRVGPRAVLVLTGLLYSAGLWWASNLDSTWELYLSLGPVMGFALSGVSYVVVLGAVGRIVAPERRSTAFGFITAAGSLGMFAVVPGVEALRAATGWRGAFGWSALILLIVPAAALLMPGADGKAETEPIEMPIMDVLRRASRNGSYLLLVAGFFVCGFHVSFIATHLPSFLTDSGLGSGVAATALSVIGLFNIVGSFGSGLLGDRYRKRTLLSILYFARATVIGLFLVIPLTTFSAIAFGAAIGTIWLATIPLTSGVVAGIFGSRYLSTLYGVVFLSHQVGAFLGIWLGGRVFDTMGTYTPVWIISIILGVAAGLLHLPIDERQADPEFVEVGKADD